MFTNICIIPFLLKYFSIWQKIKTLFTTNNGHIINAHIFPFLLKFSIWMHVSAHHIIRWSGSSARTAASQRWYRPGHWEPQVQWPHTSHFSYLLPAVIQWKTKGEAEQEGDEGANPRTGLVMWQREGTSILHRHSGASRGRCRSHHQTRSAHVPWKARWMPAGRETTHCQKRFSAVFRHLQVKQPLQARDRKQRTDTNECSSVFQNLLLLRKSL